MKGWVTSARLPQDKKALSWRYAISLVRRRRRRKKMSASSLLRKSLGCHQLFNPFLLFNTLRQFYILPCVPHQGDMTAFPESSCGRPSKAFGTVVTGTCTNALCIFVMSLESLLSRKMWQLLITQTMRTWGGAHSELGWLVKYWAAKYTVI